MTEQRLAAMRRRWLELISGYPPPETVSGGEAKKAFSRREDPHAAPDSNSRGMDPIRPRNVGDVTQALESRIGLLRGWGPEAAREASSLMNRLTRLWVTAPNGPGDPTLADDIDEVFAGWRAAREHDVLMTKLQKELACIATIPGRGDAAHRLKPQWAAYEAAAAEMPVIPLTDRSDGDLLTRKRTAYEAAAKALMNAWEESTPGPDETYYKQRFSDLSTNTAYHLVARAKCAPANSRRAADLHVKLAGQVTDLKASPRDSTWRDCCEAVRAVCETAQALIDTRASPDILEARFFTAYRALEPDIMAAVSAEGSTPSSPMRPAEQLRAALSAKLEGADPDRYQVCSELLAELKATADMTLRRATEALSQEIARIAKLPEASLADKLAKVTQASALIERGDAAILGRQSLGQQVTLLEALRSAGMPASDGPAAWRRVAMRKLYKASHLDPAFAAAEDAGRETMLQRLSANKAELKQARDSWLVLTVDQKRKVLTMVMTAQSAALDFEAPRGGAVFENFAASGRDVLNAGEYDLPPGDIIRINTGSPAFDDFETMLDLVFHENSHKRQDVLVRRLRAESPPMGEPPLTQTRMFASNLHATNGYVGGREDLEAYQRQPVESHAWATGARTARALLDMLEADSTGAAASAPLPKSLTLAIFDVFTLRPDGALDAPIGQLTSEPGGHLRVFAVKAAFARRLRGIIEVLNRKPCIVELMPVDDRERPFGVMACVHERDAPDFLPALHRYLRRYYVLGLIAADRTLPDPAANARDPTGHLELVLGDYWAAEGRFSVVRPEWDRQTAAVERLSSQVVAAASLRDGYKATTSSQVALLAQNLIERTDPELLRRLAPTEQLTLLETLNAAGMPTPAAARSKLRDAMLKFYKAIVLHPAFAAADDADLAERVARLRAEHAAVLRRARDSWLLLTGDQRKPLLAMMVQAQCRTPGFDQPCDGDDAADEGQTMAAVANDFEAALEVASHEHTRRRQEFLVRQIRAGALAMGEPLFTQARMFACNLDAANGYVTAAENPEAHLKQPVEAHALRAGVKAAQAVLAILS